MIHKRFLSCSVTNQVQASGSHHYSPTKQGAGTDGKLGKKNTEETNFAMISPLRLAVETTKLPSGVKSGR